MPNAVKLKKHELEQIAELEHTVLYGTPQYVKALAASREYALSARALGLACRYGGFDKVKALVETGITFKFNEQIVIKSYYDLFGGYFSGKYLGIDFSRMLLRDYEMIGDGYMSNYILYKTHTKQLPEVISEPERYKIVCYLCDNAEKVRFDLNEFLYYMIFEAGCENGSAFDKKTIEVLRRKGAALPKEKINMMTEGSQRDDWFEYCYYVQRLSDNNFIPVLSEIISEIGGDKKLHMTEHFFRKNEKHLLKTENFRFMFEHFDLSKLSKIKFIKMIIDHELVSCLDIIAENGWLKQPAKRDEMIDYASENHKTECTAYLLDYKNRTADLAAERAKAEKKLERELNADPNSVTELKKNWGFKKKADGTLIITGYKGKSTVINVPEKIGGDKVTEIDEWALSPSALRIKAPTRIFRKTIIKITLPDSIKKIGRSAFRGLTSLQELIIGKGVKKIGENAFSDCVSLKSLVIPEGVKVIDDNAFSCYSNVSELESVVLPSTLDIFNSGEGVTLRRNLFLNSPKLTVTIPPLENAKKYCEIHKLNFKYYDIESVKKYYQSRRKK